MNATVADATVQLAPVAGKARIDVLDVLRGIAILGIFFMNIPFMAARVIDTFVNPRLLGWTPADQVSWTAVQLLLEGTQRGLLELLFGAGLMVLAARAMSPDGPVAVADLYARRNLWLLGFGLVDIFVLLWAGDILHMYALAAMFLFPFRKLGPKLLLALGLGYAAFVLVSGSVQYAERASLVARVQAVEQKQAAKATLSAEEKKTLEKWKKVVAGRSGQDPGAVKYRAQEQRAHAGTAFIPYAKLNIGTYVFFILESLLPYTIEAFCMMLIGIALWKWGVIQGERSMRFYLLLMLACYVPGLVLRWFAVQEMLVTVPIPRTHWFTQEFSRIAVSIGHLALINLAMKSAPGRAILSPFKAAGRTAFSLYVLQTILGIWILFAPWGLGLWGKLSWGGMYSVVAIAIVGQLILANIWLIFFTSGPLEWAWRSLSYVRRQPFVRRRG
jgi:uncharacterized protein